MTKTINQTERNNWLCASCGIALEPGKVTVSYLGNAYPVDLLRCPRCGLTWVPEELALGKMAEVKKPSKTSEITTDEHSQSSSHKSYNRLLAKKEKTSIWLS